MTFYFQKQPPELFCKKGVLKTSQKFHRKTPVLGSPFNKVPCLQACNFIKRNSNVGVFS